MAFDKFQRIFQRMVQKPKVSTAPVSEDCQKQNPRIIGLSMVKNEQDIIEPFIRHNIRFLDALIIMDNASVDKTRDIALACARELGNVIVNDSDEFSYNQSERMTRMLQYCQSAFFAHFVMFLDADEFISAPNRAALTEALDQIPEAGVGRMPWRTFVITPEQGDTVGQDVPRLFTHRRKAERPTFYKAILRLDGQYHPNTTIMQGNHDASRDGTHMPTILMDNLPLLHFPVRSCAQLASKSTVGWNAYLARNPDARATSEGFQWRKGFDLLSDGGMVEIERQLPVASLEYAQEPHQPSWQSDVTADTAPSNYVRRYSDGQFMDPLAITARSWERSLVPTPPVVHLTRPVSASDGTGLTKTSFDAAWHWDHFFFDVQPFRFIAEKYQPKQVLDLGCGIGQYLALFKALGAEEVFGIDGVPVEATRGVLDQSEYSSRNLSHPIDLERKFDLVVCVEVAEHMDAADGTTLLDTIARHAAERIVFSAAEPGQPGNGHINCQPLSYWLELLAQRGWIPDLIDSLGMRALSTMSWFRRNLVVLRQGSVDEGRAATGALTQIAAKPYAWYGQDPGIRETAFTDPLFGPGEGYHASPASRLNETPR